MSAGTTFKTTADPRAWLSSIETELNRGEYVDPTSGTERFGHYAKR